MKKYIAQIFIYLSIIFLLIALVKADYLKIPDIKNFNSLIYSFILLFSGFIFNGLSWGKLLKTNYKSIKNKDSLSSVGLSVFGKYIPGKLWVILGRSEIISKKYYLPRKDITTLSLTAQFISIWMGLIIGSLGLIFIKSFKAYSILIIVFLLVLSLIIFTNLFQKSFNYLSYRIFKKTFFLPSISLKKTFSVLPWYFINWLLWCCAFYFLTTSLVDYTVSINIAWGFALSASLGIIAVFAPGGLGIREGLIVAYLSLADIPLADATTIAVTSRLWFLSGEIFIFIIALLLNKKID